MGVVLSDLKLEVEIYENIDSIVEDLEKKLNELTEEVEAKKTTVLTVWKKNAGTTVI